MEDSIPDPPQDTTPDQVEDSIRGRVEDKIPEGFARGLPPGIGELKVEPERQLTMASLGSKPWVRKFGWLLILVSVGIAFGLFYLSMWHPPSEQQAEQDVSALVGRVNDTTVTAKCTVPDKTGYSCGLRDAAGDYGYSTTFFTNDNDDSGDRYEAAERISDTSFGFPIHPDGTGSMTLNASPPGDLSLALTGALDMIGSSLGNPNLLALYGAIYCGDQSQLTTTGTACTVRSPILSATIRSVGDGRFQLAYRVRLPGS